MCIIPCTKKIYALFQVTQNTHVFKVTKNTHVSIQVIKTMKVSFQAIKKHIYYMYHSMKYQA